MRWWFSQGTKWMICTSFLSQPRQQSAIQTTLCKRVALSWFYPFLLFHFQIKICRVLNNLALFPSRNSTFKEPYQITGFKCLIYSRARVLNQLQLAAMVCVQKRKLALAPYSFLSLQFSQELERLFQQVTESMIYGSAF